MPALLVIASTWTVGLSLELTASAAPPPPPGPLVQPAVPGPGHAYLGGWVNPVATAVQHNEAELAALPALNQGLGRNLSIVSLYQDWNNPVQPGVLEQVLAQGGIPMINWRCGVSDASIISGADDAFILSFANRLKALQSPVFLRWYFEPNLLGSVAHQQCLGAAGPAGYQQAYQRMHSLFQAAGATNVAFVWCIATANTADQAYSSYYPGAASVDWIAADGYYRSGTPASNAFSLKFDPWYQTFAGYGKPMMVTETATFDTSQQTYLSEIASDLSTRYPQIRGLVYFDAPADAGSFTYPLTGSGLQTFQALSRSSLFLPDRQTPTFAVAASGPATAGRGVKLTATTGGTDGGGTITYLANGVPISGCSLLPAYSVPSCEAILPEGQSNVVLAYSGDALFAGASSLPLPMMVQPAPTTNPGGSTGGGGPVITLAPVPTTVTPPTVPADVGPGKMGDFATVAPVPLLGPVQITEHLSPQAELINKTAPEFPPVATGNGTGLASINGTVPPSPMLAHSTGWVLAGLAVAFLLVVYLVTTSVRDRRQAHPESDSSS